MNDTLEVTNVAMPGWRLKDGSKVDKEDCWTDSVDLEAFKNPRGVTGMLNDWLGDFLSWGSRHRTLGVVPSAA